MITQTQRDELKKHLKNGDLPRAAGIYERIAGRPISRKMLEKFMSGERKCLGTKPGAHDPLKMYEAVARSVAQRRENEQRMQKLADQVLESTRQQATALAVC